MSHLPTCGSSSMAYPHRAEQGDLTARQRATRAMRPLVPADERYHLTIEEVRFERYRSYFANKP